MFRKTFLWGMSIVLLGGVMFSVSDASAASQAKKFRNCSELNRVYKGGVAQAPGVKNKGGKTKYAPFVSKALYDANKKLDRDKDRIACEK